MNDPGPAVEKVTFYERRPPFPRWIAPISASQILTDTYFPDTGGDSASVLLLGLDEDGSVLAGKHFFSGLLSEHAPGLKGKTMDFRP
jgi:hypothetical protein